MHLHLVHLRSLGCESAVLNNEVEVGQRALVILAAQFIESEIILLCDMAQSVDEQGESTPVNGRWGEAGNC